MDIQDEVFYNNNIFGGGQSNSIVKGKRTKRQRPQSPIPFTMITSSPTKNISTTNTTTSNSCKSDEGSDICSNNHLVEELTTATITTTFDKNDNNFRTTEEEEDMANCLILLAQGKSRPHPSPAPLLSLVDNNQQPTSKINHINDNSNNSNIKFVSRKFMEAPSSTQGKSGYYVYECKTCGKTFSSFQALGGHRASHKKPKNKDENYNTTKNFARSNKNSNAFSTITSSPNTNRNYYNHNINMLSSDDEDPPCKVTGHNDNNTNISSSTSLSLQLTNRALWGQQSSSNNNKGRVHECSICAAEFSSGQALGGHMRRHRGPLSSTAATIAAPMIAAIPLSVQQPTRNNNIINDSNYNSGNNNNNNNIINNTNILSLDLDLNLPAPLEENNLNVGERPRERSRFLFEQTTTNDNEQHSPSPPSQQLVFSSPTLVDCHY